MINVAADCVFMWRCLYAYRSFRIESRRSSAARIDVSGTFCGSLQVATSTSATAGKQAVMLISVRLQNGPHPHNKQPSKHKHR